MPSATERARELPPGSELDALFFGTCWPNEPLPPSLWYQYVDGEPVFRKYPPVSAAAAACESWVMRWLRENGICFQIFEKGRDRTERRVAVNIYRYEDEGDPVILNRGTAYGNDWKHALTRAAIAANEQMEKRDGN